MQNPTAILEMYDRATVAGTPHAITSKVITRQLRESARLAVNFPEHERTVEMTVSPTGVFTVQLGPAPGHGGTFITVYSGHVRDEV